MPNRGKKKFVSNNIYQKIAINLFININPITLLKLVPDTSLNRQRCYKHAIKF
jgi:hypothetical protein